jgi:hypothetical protein
LVTALAALHADGLARDFLVGDLVLRLAAIAEKLHRFTVTRASPRLARFRALRAPNSRRRHEERGPKIRDCQNAGGPLRAERAVRVLAGPPGRGRGRRGGSSRQRRGEGAPSPTRATSSCAL